MSVSIFFMSCEQSIFFVMRWASGWDGLVVINPSHSTHPSTINTSNKNSPFEYNISNISRACSFLICTCGTLMLMSLFSFVWNIVWNVSSNWVSVRRLDVAHLSFSNSLILFSTRYSILKISAH